MRDFVTGDEPEDWREWDAKWRKTIVAQSGFEWNFAKEVIQRVPGLKPSQVTPQWPFVGNDGRERHMDFGIQASGRKVAVEIEGWDKTGEGRGKTKQEHDEFNRRIQSLTAAGWSVLTVTNAQFMADPGLYSSQLRQMLLDAGPSLQPTSQGPPPPTALVPPTLAPPEAPSITPVSSGSSGPKALWWVLGIAAVALLGLIVVMLGRDSSGGPANPDSPASSAPGSLTNPGNTKDCEDFSTQAEAQEWFETYLPQFGDVANLDGDKDGRVCVSLP